MFKPRHFSAGGLFWVSTSAIVISAALAASAVAGSREPLIAPHPWDFPDRNRETALAFQISHDNDDGFAGAAGMAAAGGVPIIINSTSTAVGNWQQIEMTLAEGAEGLIMTENHQDNSGDANAVSDVLNDSNLAISKGNTGVSAGPTADHSDQSADHSGEMTRHARLTRTHRKPDGSRDQQERESPIQLPEDHRWSMNSGNSHQYEVDHRLDLAGHQDSGFDWGTEE